MANMMKMLKQAQQMQAKMEKMQQELGAEVVEFTAGGGMVTAEATCDGNIKSLKIDPKCVDPEDVEMLEDLVLAAVEGALQTGRDKMASEMSEITKGMNIPGMNLPF
jgi:DNA-binding YbaB/EbfC family protein